jgi:nitrite reductase/ring-hydroxylating ferredoxin subunit
VRTDCTPGDQSLSANIGGAPGAAAGARSSLSMNGEAMTDLAAKPLGDLGAVAEMLGNGFSIPYRWYSDPDVFHFERENIFRKSWHVAGPLEKVARPGDHIVVEAAGIPILVVRGRDDELRAFLNICRHRGFPVAREDGSRKFLMCHYHAWTYNLDGTLKGAPGCDTDPNFDKSSISLLPVAVDVIAGVVLVNPDVDALPFRQAHPTVESWVKELKLDLTQYKFVKQLSYEVPGNWKLVYENASECYHCPTIHPTSLTSLYDPHGEREFCDEELVIAHAPRLDKNGQGIRAIMGFPGFVIQQDDFVGLSAQVIPDDYGRTRFLADVYANPDLTESELAEHLDLWDRTFQEDMGAVEAVYRGVSTGRMPFGRLVAAREERTAHIQRIILDAYQKASNTVGVV